MNGFMSQHYKGSCTHKTSDQGLVVLLNSGYELLNYIINERLKRIVEQANVSQPGQGESRFTSTCKKCISSLLKPTDKESESRH